MKHDSEAFFRELKGLQDRYLVNISARENQVIFDFADDPRLKLEMRIVVENGRRVLRDVPVFRP